MKKLLTLLVLLTGMFIGCQEENSLVDSVTNSVEKNNKEWLQFPAGEKVSVETIYNLEKYIDGRDGGSFSFAGYMSNNIYVNGSISVPRYAYSGSKKITVQIDSETITNQFFPSPTTFDKPLVYSIGYYGIDLSNVNRNNIDFYYINPNGQLVKANYDKIEVGYDYIKVVNAELPHFSRYGFVQ